MQFWVLDDVGVGADHDRWWGLVLSKRAASFGEENWWEVFRGNRPPPSEPAPFRICDVRPRHEQGDVMYTDLLGRSFSTRMADLLVSIGCTGFSPNPSIIYDTRDREVVCTDAKWTQFQDGCGPPDLKRGYDPLGPHTHRKVGLFFDHSTWTGLDMFRPVKSVPIVITDRIARAIHGAGLRGYHLVRSEEYGADMVAALNSLGRWPGRQACRMVSPRQGLERIEPRPWSVTGRRRGTIARYPRPWPRAPTMARR